MPDVVTLVGLDFGTTTCGAVVASGRLTRSTATGRMELTEVCERYRSEMVFTPLSDDDRLDERQVERYLTTWLADGGITSASQGAQVFGGGALLTGLTAQKENAAALVRLIRRRLGDALVATADDPCLESWLSFMGSCASLSRAHPHQAFLNLDVGGGTTNVALGRAGEVRRTGCLFVGARHFQVVPGTYRIVKISRYAQALLDHLGGAARGKGPGDCLTDAEVEAILDFYVTLLEAVAAGTPQVFQESIAHLHEQVAFRPAASIVDCAVTFSGGVGELIYRHLEGQPWPSTTHYGDLGIDLARRIVRSPILGRHLRTFRPAAGGRATVYGLLRHATEVSGTTLFLPRPDVLPLTDVPIMGSLRAGSDDSQVRDVIELILRSPRGGCVQLALGGEDAATIRATGKKIARVLREVSFPAAHPLVILVEENVGKALGQYVTEWGALPLNLVVIDEVAPRNAQYAQIGSLHSQVVPVSFFGLNE